MQGNLIGIWLVTAVVLWIGLYFVISMPRQKSRREELISSIVKSVTLRCPDYENVVQYSSLFCDLLSQKLELPKKLQNDLAIAIKLRGVGLLALPFDMLQTGQIYHWSSAEKYVFEQHPVASHAIVRQISILADYGPLLEPFQGSIKNSNISDQRQLASQIIQIVSDYSWNVLWYGRTAANEKLNGYERIASNANIIQLLQQVLPSDSEVIIAQPV